MINRHGLTLLVTLVALTFSSEVIAQDWAQFRGPNGTGVSTDEAPVTWSDSENLKWKTPLPGAGVSCPIVVGDKLFLTCYSGYGLDRRNPGDMKQLKRHVVCVDRDSGKVLWDKTIKSEVDEDTYSGMGVPEHGYASHTPVSDGKNIYAFLGKSGVYAFDFEGNQLWKSNVGTASDDRRWGSASSPVETGDIVVVPAIAESTALYGLDKKTGKEVWKTEADGLRGSWSTPLVVKVDDDRTDIVMAVPGEIWGINPKNGKLRWFCAEIPGSSYYSSLSIRDGVIYGSVGGRGGGGSFALKVGGKGDVTKSHIVWRGGDQSSYGAPVLQGDKMFLVSRGTATSVDLKNGERVERVRLESAGQESQDGGGRFGRGGGRMGGDYSSPVVANDKMYYVKRNGETYVFSTGSKLEQVAVNRVTKDEEEFSASPAISNGQIFLRSNKHLYCIESSKK